MSSAIRLPIILVLCAQILATAGCLAQPREPAARHLLLVTLDTTRADRLGCYGRPSAGTPWLDGLAARGARFERTYAQVPLTLPSHVCILTGLFPTRTGVHANGQTTLSPQARTLAEILASRGFFTAGAVGGYPVAGRFPVRRGFERFDDQMTDPRNPEGLERDAGEVLRAALRLLAGRRDGRFAGSGGNGTAASRVFLWVHLFDPHDPYDPPSPFRERYSTDPYQGEIARADAALSEFFPLLERELAGESLLVCVIGDHGEGLGEHSEDTHGFFLYEPTVRVPLIMAGPRVPGGRVFDDPVQSVDVLPTLLDLLDVAPPSGLDGVKLTLDGKRKETGPPERVYLETELPLRNYGWSPLHGAVEGVVKYISAPTPELYDLAADPREMQNLAGSRPQQTAALSEWIAVVGGAKTTAMSEEVDDDSRLRSLGYVSMAPTSTGEGSREDPKDKTDVYREFQAAARALEQGKPEEALPILDRLLAGSDTAGVRFQTATALRMLGRLGEAAGELQRVAAKEPEFPGLHMERTRIAIAQGDARTGLSEVERHLSRNPTDAEALMFRGAAREMLGNLTGAEQDYRRALELNPAFDGASLRLAALLVRSGRLDEAARALRERLVRDPNDRLARGLLDSIQEQN